MKIPLLGKLYILAVVLIGALLGATVLSHWQSHNLIRFACYLALSLFAARLKATLPGITGSISVLFIFILFAIVELDLAQALVIGCVATLAQCCWKKLYQPLHHPGPHRTGNHAVVRPDALRPGTAGPLRDRARNPG